MPDNGAPIEPVQPPPPRLSALAETLFFGPNGLRAGWRLLFAFSIFFPAFIAANAAVRQARSAATLRLFSTFSPQGVLIGEAISFGVYLFTIWVMSLIEARRIRDYGIGLRSAFGGKFWLGVLAGFAAISLLLGTLKLAGAFQLGSAALHGSLAWEDAALWALTFLFVGFSEEGTTRGYLLFTLSTGIGFWPAAIATSVAFGGLHWGNSGESFVGMLSAGGVGFFFCMLIRKTGTLWPAIGFHAAWDWGETYFYGVPDSGLTAPGHLFTAKFAGPAWLTGGTVGPEGSWLCVILIILLCVGAAFLPGARFPDPSAVPDPRRREPERGPTLFPETTNQLPERTS